ncbi:hypothetical protein [Actinopolymorpha alba]|uniref:hypothetical protein n=1 Tax=Actinopolymorpha alba TaxID=533267 RepID=UPI00035F2309|nr:hypothetical protein [Actinopolymorpha alba]
MTTIKRLMRTSNPVPGPWTTELSERARNELKELVETTAQEQAPRTVARRRRLVMVLAASSAVVVAVIIGWTAIRTGGGGTAEPPMVDEPVYENSRALEDRADLILRGTVVSTREQDSNGFPETIARVEVEKVAKGQVAAGRQIEVAYVTPGSGPETPTGMSVGGRYVLLLASYTDAPASLVNTFQGYYTISGGRAVPAPDNDVALSPAVKQTLGVQ